MIGSQQLSIGTQRQTRRAGALESFRTQLQGTPGHCGGCHVPLDSEPVYRIPGLAGVFCSVACVESVLFGVGHCHWCGTGMDSSYPKDGTVYCRLCSSDCRENYQRFVLGDHSARLGTGKRLLVWLRQQQPKVYRQITKTDVPNGRLCQNPKCKRGEKGQPATVAHLRGGARYCSDACKKQVQREARPPLQTPLRANVYAGLNGDTFTRYVAMSTPAVLAVSRRFFPVGGER